MTDTTAENSPRISFLEWLRALDEALHPDPVEALNQRFDQLEAKFEAINAIGSAHPVTVEVQRGKKTSTAPRPRYGD